MVTMLKPRIGTAPSRLSTGKSRELLPSSKWETLRRFVLRRDCGLCKCATCTAAGILKAATEVDHVVPRHLGGSDDPGNLAAINVDCHKAKTAREVRAMRGGGT